MKVIVENDHSFRRSGCDLHTEITISLREALLGFSRSIKHLDGHQVQLTRTNITKPGQVFQIIHEGMGFVDDEGGEHKERGTLHVKVQVQFPDSLSTDARSWAESVLPTLTTP